MNNLAMNL